MTTGAARRPAPAPPPDPPQRAASLAPWQLAVSSSLMIAMMSVVGATAPDLRAYLGVSTSALTLAFIGQMAGAFAGAVIIARARHRVLELSPLALLAAAAVGAAALAPSLPFLVAAMLVAGAGGMGVNATAQAETMRRAGPRRARALSQYHTWGGAGSVVFPLAVAGLLAVGVPWQSAFVLIVVAYVAHAWVNRHLRVVHAQRDTGSARPAIGPRARWAVVVAVVAGGIQLTFPLYFSSLAVDHFGASAATGSAVIGVYALGILIARAGGTAVMPRLPVDRQLRAGCAVMLAGYVLLAVAGALPLLVVAAFLLGLGIGQLLPLGMARSAREIGDDRYSTGIVYTWNSVMQLASPALVALLLQVMDLRAALVATVPLALLIVLAVWRSRPADPALLAPAR